MKDEQQPENSTLKREQVRVNWFIRAHVECPHCGYVHDFMDMDDWSEFCGVGENTDFTNPYELPCNVCGKNISITGSDY